MAKMMDMIDWKPEASIFEEAASSIFYDVSVDSDDAAFQAASFFEDESLCEAFQLANDDSQVGSGGGNTSVDLADFGELLNVVIKDEKEEPNFEIEPVPSSIDKEKKPQQKKRGKKAPKKQKPKKKLALVDDRNTRKASELAAKSGMVDEEVVLSIKKEEPDSSIEPVSIGRAKPKKTKKKPALRKYHCDLCGKSFVTPSKYRQHINVHTGKRPYSCRKCGKGLTTMSTLRAHISIIHENRSAFSCPKCGKFFSSKYALADHKKVHTNDRPHQCSLCLEENVVKKFKFLSGLYNHVTNHHFGTLRGPVAEPIYCYICKRMFRAKANMMAHVLLKHSVKDAPID